MKISFTFWKLLLLTLFISPSVFGQAVGDYQTDAIGSWGDAAIWDVWDGDSWEDAGAIPTSADGVITILSGHTVTSNAARTVDQVVVAAGGTLSVQTNVFTVADDGTAAVDLQVDGTLNLDALLIDNAGGATALINGVFNWNGGRINVPTTIAAAATVNLATNNTKFLGADMVNNGTFNWDAGATAGSINFPTDGVTFTNNGTIHAIFTTDRGFAGTSAHSFVNNGTLVIHNPITFTTNVAVTNPGRLQGVGTVAFGGTGSFDNTGTIAPGVSLASPGIFTVGASFIDATGAVEIAIISGTTPGTGHDQLEIVGNAILGGNLTIIDNPLAPAGVYTIITHTGGFGLSGTFATVTKPINFGDPVYDYINDVVTIEKLVVLPVVWGDFSALAKNSDVLLNWSTLQESNTSHFVVEHSSNGLQYAAIGSVAAQGNSSTVSKYSFTHTSPAQGGNNYYRIQQVDLDGKATFSATRTVRFSNGSATAVLATPNPVRSVLQLSVQATDITVTLSDLKGSPLRTLKLQPGNHQVDVNNLPAGTYQLTIYQKQKRIDVQRIIKL